MTKKVMIEEMTEEWVGFWHQCLRGNMDYYRYHVATTEGNVKVQKYLEAKFEYIAEIYGDFGDVGLIEDYSSNGSDWCAWFEPRRHLFMADVRQVDAPSQQLGHICLDVPMTEDVKRTKERVAAFFDEYYKKNTIVPAGEPKYKLYIKANGYVGCRIESVRKACFVQRGCYAFSFDSSDRYDALTLKKTIEAFLMNEHSNFDGLFPPKAKAEFLRSGRLDEDDFDRFKKDFFTARNNYKRLAANVLRKSFPDLRPFESSVLDNVKP